MSLFNLVRHRLQDNPLSFEPGTFGAPGQVELAGDSSVPAADLNRDTGVTKQVSPRPVWSDEFCGKLMTKYPNDIDLWKRSLAYLDEEEDSGAPQQWVLACVSNLERAWEAARLSKTPKLEVAASAIFDGDLTSNDSG